ncbi:MAG: alkaline phosphatase D family protein [Burkholderiaceae bacterium]
MKRRDLHRAALAWALSSWVQAGAQGAPGPAPRWRANPFALGVASGMPRPDSVVLWTRLLPGEDDQNAMSPGESVRVSYELYSDPALRQLLRRGELATSAARAHSLHVPLQGLQAGREYWFRFTCGDAVSPVGRTRTAPAADAPVARLRLALASCQHWEQGHYAAHREIAAQELDFVLFVGDYIYEGSSPRYTVRRHTGGVPHTLDEYRQRHALYKSDAELQAAHAAHPWVLMWDDHEVVNDYANDRDPRYSDPVLFLKRRAAAYRAYFEHMPLRLPPQGASMRIHDQLVWGRLAELWTLDCRQYRSHQACPDPLKGGGRLVVDCQELADPQRSLLGPAQERWLQEGLQGSRRRWKLLAQATQISSTGLDSPVPGTGRATYTDAWDGYPEARSRLLQTVADAKLQDVVTLGGDVHRHVAANLRLRPNDAASPALASEFVTSSITSQGGPEALLSRMRASNPDLVHARADERGYALLELTPQLMRCDFRGTPHPAGADGRLRTQASFVVEQGRAGVQAA